MLQAYSRSESHCLHTNSKESAAATTATGGDGQKKQLLLKKVTNFFKVESRFMAMYNVVHMNSIVSLRMCEFVCTTFAEQSKQGLWTTADNGEAVDVELSYRSWQEADGKNHFDAFRRHKKCSLIRLQMHGKSMLTNIAQLRFFQFIISKGVMQYIETHVRSIEVAMSAHVAAQKQQNQESRRKTNQKKRRNVVSARSIKNKRVCLM